MKISTIRFEHVTFGFTPAQQILKDVSLSVNMDQSIFLLGNSGGGKSTFLKLATGLVVPDEGEVFFDQLRTRKMSKSQLMDYHKDHAFLSQNAGLLNNMNLYDNIALPLRYGTQKTEEQIAQIIDPILEELEISRKELYVFPGHLNRGKRILIAFARSLTTDPGYYFLDEPMTGLDPLITRKIEGLITGLRERGRGLMMGTRNLDFVFRMADQVLVFYEGKVIFDGTPDQCGSCDHFFMKELLHDSGKM